MSGEFFMSWKNLVCGYKFGLEHHEPFSGEFSGAGLRALTGSNGCGKSTLLKTWLKINKPLSGTIQINSVKPLGYVPQQSSVNSFFPIKVLNFIELGLNRNQETLLNNKILIKELANTWELNLASEYHTLSAGQKTRALVARALALKPDVLFLDEPLANLDKHCQSFLMEELHRYSHAKNMSVIIVDHHLAEYGHWFTDMYEFTRLHNKNLCTIEHKKQKHRCT
jgi:ABC-type Mn2+/Zn2+ transport system ATPase subunit